MLKPAIQILSLLVCLTFSVSGQTGLQDNLQQKVENERALRLMFYNCENLFDIFDDSIKNDDEFLPEGEKYWSKHKYYEKLNKTSQVIMAVGGWKPPELVALCEIENKSVLNDLTSKTQLYQAEYKTIHKESPDKRGIDVALLYNPKKFIPIKISFIQIDFKDKGAYPTRDVLYTTGVTNSLDTIHIFVNHWPSRWGGQLETEEKRKFVASVVKSKVDSIFSTTNQANIIITGDLNDEPINQSVKNILGAKIAAEKPFRSKAIYNLTQIGFAESNIGTHKHQGNWSILDQIIVSGNLLDKSNTLFTTPELCTIFNASFLLIDDKNYLGKKPLRTYIGYKYEGGFSDHLPVFIDLNTN